jgi:hypothetical protein
MANSGKRRYLGGEIHFFTVNKTLLITEFILIFILYGVSLLFCLFIDRN